MSGITKIFKNRTVVTIIGVALIIVLLYVGYTSAVNKATAPITVWVAAEDIQPRTLITESMVKQIKVSGDVANGQIVNVKSQIVGKYSNYNTVIPAESMFYRIALIEEKDLPDAAFIDIPANQVPYNFAVTTKSTYGNSIYPGNLIDIYMKVVNEDGQIMFGELLTNIKVAAVKDSSGRNVFEVSDGSRTPAFIIFGLSCEDNNLLRKASYLSAYSVELIPVPSGVAITGGTSEIVVTSTKLQDFILSHTVTNDEAEYEKCQVVTGGDDDIESDIDTDNNTENTENEELEAE